MSTFQRLELVKDYYANTRSAVATVRTLCAKQGRHNVFSEHAMQRIICKMRK